MDTLSRRLVVLGVALTTVVSTLVAQTPPVKDMAELVATLKDASLTLGRKQGLVRQKLVRHKEGYDGRPDEWLVFDQVMIGGR